MKSLSLSLLLAVFLGSSLAYSSAPVPKTYVGYIQAEETYFQMGSPYTELCSGMTTPGINPACRVFVAKVLTLSGEERRNGFEIPGGSVSVRPGQLVPRVFNAWGVEFAHGDIVEIKGEVDLEKSRFTRVNSIKILDAQPRFRCETVQNDDLDHSIRLYFLRGADSIDRERRAYLSSFMRADMGNAQKHDLSGTTILSGVQVPHGERGNPLVGTSIENNFGFAHKYLKEILNEGQDVKADTLFPRPAVREKMSLQLTGPLERTGEVNASLTLEADLTSAQGRNYHAERVFRMSCRADVF